MTETKKIEFSSKSLAEAKAIISHYPEGKQKSALLPILHLAQAEFDGWLSTEVMDYVASLLNIKTIEVYEVASFYSMYNLKPGGKYYENLTEEKLDEMISNMKAENKRQTYF